MTFGVFHEEVHRKLRKAEEKQMKRVCVAGKEKTSDVTFPLRDASPLPQLRSPFALERISHRE